MTSTVFYSFYKTSEGGPGQASVIRQLKDAGITNVRRAESPYVGHTAVAVTGTKQALQAELAAEAAMYEKMYAEAEEDDRM